MRPPRATTAGGLRVARRRGTSATAGTVGGRAPTGYHLRDGPDPCTQRLTAQARGRRAPPG